jgi:molybdopterin converting factor small subunit
LKKNIKVTVKFYGHFHQGGGELIEEVEVTPETTVKGVVDFFSRQHQTSLAGSSQSSTPRNIEQTHVVMVNGISVEKIKLSTSTVQEGDKITIFLPISGG